VTDRTKGIVSIVISAFGFALMAMLVRLCDTAGSPISAFQKSFLRNAISAMIAISVFVVKGRSDFGAVRITPSLLLRCIFGTVGIVANYYALSHINIAEAQTLNKTAQFFTVIIAWLFLGEQLRMRQIAAVAVAFSGVLLITKPGFAGSDGFALAMGLLGGLAAGSAYACTRRLAVLGIPVRFIVAFFSSFATLACVPFLVASGWNAMNVTQYLIIIAAGGAALIGQYGITAAYRFARAGELAAWDYTNILFTVLFGLFCFGQVPDVFAFAGMALVVSAALFTNKRSKP